MIAQNKVKEKTQIKTIYSPFREYTASGKIGAVIETSSEQLSR